MRILRFIGSTAFAVGIFVILFVAIPWVVTVVDEPTLGGRMPWWFRGSVYLVLGGIIVVLASVAIEQLLSGPELDFEAPLPEGRDLLVLNTGSVPGREITEVLGLVQGHTIFAIWLGNDLSALVRMVLGGELIEYTGMMGKARNVAMQRMRTEARELGAEAIVNVRLTTTSVVGTAAELLAYGTAVRLAD